MRMDSYSSGNDNDVDMEPPLITDYGADARMLKALAHPTRLRIVDAIRQGKHCVRDLEELLGLNQSNVSQHLTILRNIEIVEPMREGNTVCYRLKNKRVMALVRFLAKSRTADTSRAAKTRDKEKKWATPYN